MPLYEFECKSCENIFEDLVFSDENPACPKCHSEKTEKLISRPCRNRNACASLGGDQASATTSSTSSSCAGCSGGSCATCGS